MKPTTNTADKVRDAMMKALRKAQGDDAVVNLRGGAARVEALPSGVEVLDGFVVGVGGLPRGRIVEVFGEESCGKSSFAQVCMAAVQRIGGTAALVETEHAFDPDRAAVLGLDLDRLVMSQPDCLEDALLTVETLLDTLPDAHPSIIVWDSIAATPTRTEIENGVVPEGEGMAEYARTMSRALRVMCGKVAAKNTVLVVTNQTRSKVGVTFGNPLTTAGGKALKFYASVRLSFSTGEAVKDGSALIGRDALVTAVKNKVRAPGRSARVRLLFDRRGYDNRWSTINFAKDHGALPEGAKATDATHAKALEALAKHPELWTAPLTPRPASAPAVAVEANDDDDVPLAEGA